MTFAILPAIDVRDGRVVRLSQGDYGRETTYDPSPTAAITDYAARGTRWLHLVDLDAAREGRYTLLPLLREIALRTPLQIQTGGGIRSESEVEQVLEAGAARVVVGTLAVRQPALVRFWLERYGAERITVALDVRQDTSGAWRVPVKGWTEDTNSTLEELVASYAAAGLRHLLCTDISRDGMLSGFNLDLYRSLAAAFPSIATQASGGVRSIEDIKAARGAGAAAAILGRALLERRFTLEDALAC
jgi:phosphoribosylformimino-5-aminoimidazole carboxamide ribotide isomerase